MTYAKYSDTLALRVNDYRWLRPNEPALDADWQAYQAWLAAGNVPLDGTLGAPSPVPSQQLAALDPRMARIGEDIITLLIAKGVMAMTDLPAVVQSLISQRQTLRGKIAHE